MRGLTPPRGRAEWQRLSAAVHETTNASGQHVMRTVEYSDWRDSGGLMAPYAGRLTDSDGASVSWQVVSFEINPDIDPKLFSVRVAPPTVAVNPVDTSPGGKWAFEQQKDAMTDTPSFVFSLNAVGQPGYIAFRCSMGQFEEAWFNPEVVLDNSNSMPRGLLGGDQPDQLVRVRVDNKIKLHTWFVSVDLKALTIGRRDLEEALKSSDYQVQFTEAFSGDRVTQFAPGGINPGLVKSACGIDLK